MRVLIVTAPYGSGHLQVSSVLKQRFLENKNAEVEVFDVFSNSSKFRNSIIKKTYLMSYNIKLLGNAYAYFFYNSERLMKTRIGKKMSEFGKKIFLKKVLSFKPDIVINTFPFYPAYDVLGSNPNIKLYTIITDYYANYFWKNDANRMHFVANEEMKRRLLNDGIDESKITISGIPINDIFYEVENKNEIIKEHELDETKPILLIFAGTYGVLPKIKKTLKNLSSELDIQIMIICGKNKRLYKNLSKFSKEYNNIKVYGYVNDMYNKMAIADLMITKPGGIALTEAINKGLPTILVKPSKGQELENALIFERNNISIVAEGSEDIAMHVKDILQNKDKLQRMKDACKKIVVPYSVDIIYNKIMDISDEVEKNNYK